MDAISTEWKSFKPHNLKVCPILLKDAVPSVVNDCIIEGKDSRVRGTHNGACSRLFQGGMVSCFTTASTADGKGIQVLKVKKRQDIENTVVLEATK